MVGLQAQATLRRQAFQGRQHGARPTAVELIYRRGRRSQQALDAGRDQAGQTG